MVKKIVFFIVLFAIASCSNYIFYSKAIPDTIKKNYSFCYKANGNIIDSLIYLNGYYSIQDIRDRYGLNDCKVHINDTFYINLMFFDDGIFLANFHDRNIVRAENNKININYYFKELIVDSIECDIFHNSSYWGLYEFFHDTIKVQYINHPSKMGPWSAWKKSYKIIDKKTIAEISTKPIDTKDKIDFFYKYYYDKTKSDTAKFVPLSNIPSSDCWLKKEKWFWCNEEDWEHYMDSVGVKR